jgi:DNA-binding NarL/FixJ family response regulator
MQPTQDRIRVVLAEDHCVVAQALELVLQDSFDVMATVRDGHELVEVAARMRPDVVITDLSMPRMDGLAAIRILRTFEEPPAIVVLSMHAEPRFVAAAVDAGANGYVLKESAGVEVRAAVRAAHDGVGYWSEGVRAAATRHPDAPGRPLQLTPRQCQVLELTARGFAMRRIAELLHISPRTVETHKYQMMESLGARTTAELVQHALRLGLVPMAVTATTEVRQVAGPRSDPPVARKRARRLLTA